MEEMNKVNRQGKYGLWEVYVPGPKSIGPSKKDYNWIWITNFGNYILIYTNEKTNEKTNGKAN
jgi:hypothetical protein